MSRTSSDECNCCRNEWIFALAGFDQQRERKEGSCSSIQGTIVAVIFIESDEEEADAMRLAMVRLPRRA